MYKKFIDYVYIMPKHPAGKSRQIISLLSGQDTKGLGISSIGRYQATVS